MQTNITNDINSWKLLSWQKSLKFVTLLQKRLFKSVYIGDFETALEVQKLILQSNSARLASIRYITQVCPNRKIAGVDGQTALTFLERFELNEFLKLNFNNWFPGQIRQVKSFNSDGSINYLYVSNVSDRVWQYLIKLSLEPIHEALFHPRNFGFRSQYEIYEIQKCILLNINKTAQGKQKRVLIIDLTKSLVNFDFNFLLSKILAPRSIKLGLRRLFSTGFSLSFSTDSIKDLDLKTLLSNILLDGVENLCRGARFGSTVIFFLKPFEDEKHLVNSLINFLAPRQIRLDEASIFLNSAVEGFDFLGWHFKVSSNDLAVSVPSYVNYQVFLLRVKRIINNSNYGSNIKANKLYPLIRDWRIYHKFSDLRGNQFSLFFIKRRAFKIFSKESRQDFYSSKRLLDKSFYFLGSIEKISDTTTAFYSPYYGHLFLGFTKTSKFNFRDNCFCVHCGMNFR